jgi:hypothetical protein
MVISIIGASKASLIVSNRPSRAKKEHGKDEHLPHRQAVLTAKGIKTATQGESKGYNSGKKVNGRKRHLLVDTLGLIISAYVSPANVQDRDGLKKGPQSVF